MNEKIKMSVVFGSLMFAIIIWNFRNYIICRIPKNTRKMYLFRKTNRTTNNVN